MRRGRDFSRFPQKSTLPPLISTSHNLQFPCSFAFCCIIPFIAVQHTTNNKKHAHKANKRFILAMDKKRTDKIIIISSALIMTNKKVNHSSSSFFFLILESV